MRFVQKAEEQNGALAPIVCVQKAVLASKGLRGVYKGGLGSYALTLMALTSIQRSGWLDKQSVDGSDGDGSVSASVTVAKDEGKKSVELDEADARDAMILGRAMIQFLKLYAYEADLTKDIIVSAKDEAEWGILAESPNALGSGLRVQDPLDASNNAGAGCFGIAGVQALFREQLEALQRAAESNFQSEVPLLMQLVMLGGPSQKVFVI